MVKRDYRRLALAAARAASEKKAEDIQVLDIRSESDLADFMVIAGAGSTVQMRAVQLAIVEALEDLGLRPLRYDGRPSARWIALDYGGLVCHILLPEARDFYRLEQMWEKPKTVHWEERKKRS